MITIRRGTKQFNSILDNAKGVTAHNYDNGYHGVPLPGLCATWDDKGAVIHLPPNKYLALLSQQNRSARLVTDPPTTGNRNHRYRLTIHSNEWYAFD